MHIKPGVSTQNRKSTLQDSDNRGSIPWLSHLLFNAIRARWVSTATVQVDAGCNRQQNHDDMELNSIHADSTPLLNEEASGPSSLRSSLDNDYYQSQGCDINIYDDTISDQITSPAGFNRGFDASTWHGGLGNREELTQHLKVAQLRSKQRVPSSFLTG